MNDKASKRITANTQSMLAKAYELKGDSITLRQIYEVVLAAAEQGFAEGYDRDATWQAHIQVATNAATLWTAARVYEKKYR